jgi:hypothetical protein
LLCSLSTIFSTHCSLLFFLQEELGTDASKPYHDAGHHSLAMPGYLKSLLIGKLKAWAFFLLTSSPSIFWNWHLLSDPIVFLCVIFSTSICQLLFVWFPHHVFVFVFF